MKKLVLLFCFLFVVAGCATLPKKAVSPEKTVFYPPLPDRPHIQFLCSISGEQDLGKKQSAFKRFLVGPPHYNSLGKPYDIGSSKGKIYVLDRAYRKIVIIDLAKKTFSFLNDRGAGRLVDPSGIWISDDGYKYVADMQRKQVVVFDEHNAFSRTYGNGHLFKRPVDVAVFGDRVYVVDIKKNRLFILSKTTGDLIKVVGKDGEFYKPSQVTVGPSGHVFVTDAFHFKVKEFTPDGKAVGSFGFHGDQIGGFARPKGLALDRNGNLYAVDAAFENVQIFNSRRELLLFFGGPGNGPGDLYLPAGIAIDYQNVDYFSKFADPNFKLEYLIYVTNMYGSRKINVYGFGHWVGEEAPGKG